MPSYKFDPDARTARLFFRYPNSRDGRQFNKTVPVANEREAQRRIAQIEDVILDLERGKLTLPAGADSDLVKRFILSGGKVESRPAPPPRPPKPTTLGEMCAYYQEKVRKDAGTRYTEDIHIGHLLDVIGTETTVASIDIDVAQSYADRRQTQTAKGRKTPTTPGTVLKELKTLCIVWNWVAGWPKAPKIPVGFPFALKEVQVMLEPPKEDFLTWAQIERIVRRGGLSEAGTKAVWERLYLDIRQIRSLLKYAQAKSVAPFLHPMLCAAAHTGARRSELCRSRVDDWNLEEEVVQFRQKKKKRDPREELSFRKVDINSVLMSVIRGWFDAHPGGQYAFPHPGGGPLRPDSASYYLKETLAGSKWKVIRGWHTLRHSFASNLARAGVDQRYIDNWMGHHTEIRQRYQHLFPKERRKIIEKLVGG